MHRDTGRKKCNLNMVHTKNNCEMFGCNTNISVNCKVLSTYCIKVCACCTACNKKGSLWALLKLHITYWVT